MCVRWEPSSADCSLGQKLATANNGKRRAAQQYYHLLVELWADCGQSGADQFVKVAYRKSAKMIVRGRSPGHYQTERRGSTSSGPGGSGGGSISGGYSQGMIGSGDYGGPGSSIMTPGYPSTYDPRPGGYGGGRHHAHSHDLGMDQMISAEEEKVLTANTKGYQYYPTSLYESEQDARHHQVELFSARSEPESNSTPSLGNAFDPTKVKPENDSLPSLFYSSPSYFSPRCGRFEGKPTSNGYYPTAIPPTSTMSMT